MNICSDFGDVKVKTEPGTSGSTATGSNDSKEKVGTHVCAVCKAEVEGLGSSRPLTRKQCSSYNIKEEDWRETMRVCSGCRCHPLPIFLPNFTDNIRFLYQMQTGASQCSVATSHVPSQLARHRNAKWSDCDQSPPSCRICQTRRENASVASCNWAIIWASAAVPASTASRGKSETTHKPTNRSCLSCLRPTQVLWHFNSLDIF